MQQTAWPRDYLGRLAGATVLASIGVFVAVWVMLFLAGGKDSTLAYVLAPLFALVGTFLVGTYAVLTGPDDTPPWPFALILGGVGGVVTWAAAVLLL